LSEKFSVSKQNLDVIFNKIYTNFIEAIDAIDNGVDQFPSKEKARYLVRTDLSSRVGSL